MRDPTARVSALAVHRALQEPRVAPPHLLALAPLPEKVRNTLRLAERDLTGGFPERDG